MGTHQGVQQGGGGGTSWAIDILSHHANIWIRFEYHILDDYLYTIVTS